MGTDPRDKIVAQFFGSNLRMAEEIMRLQDQIAELRSALDQANIGSSLSTHLWDTMENGTEFAHREGSYVEQGE